MLLQTRNDISATFSAPARPRRRLPSLTRRVRFLALCLCAAVTLAAISHTAWAHAEAKGRTLIVRKAPVARVDFIGPPTLRDLWVQDLRGRSTLVVGDSMVLAWPWVADRISLPGSPTPEIRAEMERHIQGRRYEQIVLWIGTAHFEANESPETYAADLRALVRLAGAHASDVILIGPFLRSSEHYAVVADAVADVRSTTPANVPIIELLDTHRRLVASGTLIAHAPDGLHLTRLSTAAVLGPRLAAHSLPLAETMDTRIAKLHATKSHTAHAS